MQYFKYGFWKVRVLQKHPPQMSLRQFVPLVFVLTLLGSALIILSSVLFLHNSVLYYISLIIPLTYLISNLSASTIIAAKKGWKYLPMLPFVFAILHLSYGLGFLAGLFKFWNRWEDKTGKVPSFHPGFE